MTTSSDQDRERAPGRDASPQRFPPPPSDAPVVVMPYALRDQLTEDLDEEHEFFEAMVPLSDKHHYRIRSIGRYGSGQYEFCGLSDGFYILFGDLNLDKQHSLFISCPDRLQVHIASNGGGEYVFPHGDKLSLAAPTTAIFIQPADEQPAQATTCAGWNRYIAISIHRSALKTLYAGGEQELPAVLQNFVNGNVDRSLSRTLRLSASLLRCLEDVHACSLEGRGRRLFLQSKALEILCQAIEAMEHGEGFGSAEATMLTARGVMKAQRVLEEKFVSPPSLEDLAHEVGLSRSGLCAGFRQILGRSVFDYTQDLRMQRALAMLNDREASISQIAHAVGYNRASSFSVAVQRHFGATPTELRRRGSTPMS